MSLLDRLLEGVEVEWKTLMEISHSISTGLNPRKNFKLNDVNEDELSIWYVTTKDYSRSEKIEFVDGKTAKITKKAKDIINKRSKLEKGDILFSAVGTVGKIALVDIDTQNFDINESTFAIKPKNDVIIPIFLVYYLRSNIIQKAIKNNLKGSTLSGVRKGTLENFKIPIPSPNNPEKSIKIQKEIVLVLNTFTGLTERLIEELTAELSARKKQYCYYRESLLTFNEGEVKHLPMDDKSLGEFIRGKRFVKTDMISEGVPCIHYGEMYTHYDTWADKTKSFVSKDLVEKKNLRLAEKGDVVIVAAGETIEDIGTGTAWLGEEGVVIHDACFYYKSNLNPKYVAYFTRTRQFHDQIKKHIRTGKISAINAKGLGKAIIPIPSPEEQERIVSILDKFDMLTTSISESLPKEIKLRKKQYEFYRNKLLTFPKDTLEA
ncbi:MAG: restriction endonuclease subunit S [Patiriisocius sp.]|uniref:restriction endonuclease subunit S n=1 Tax=Patiriisocius sp. TaxID=2822396 RepID=UPI003EF94A5E